jgi:hypothetical protein
VAVAWITTSDAPIAGRNSLGGTSARQPGLLERFGRGPRASGDGKNAETEATAEGGRNARKRGLHGYRKYLAANRAHMSRDNPPPVGPLAPDSGVTHGSAERRAFERAGHVHSHTYHRNVSEKLHTLLARL